MEVASRAILPSSQHAHYTMATAKLGPEPVLISRKEVDALYEILAAVIVALDTLDVDYIVTGGSLLGAVRQHSILFCDDDIDIAIIEDGSGAYGRASAKLAELLGPAFAYKIRPWEGADKIRLKRMPTVFLDLFTIRRYATAAELRGVLAVKANGQPQRDEYVQGIVDTIHISSEGDRPLFPLWHFDTRKAVEMWPKEVYRERELFPLQPNLNFGPLAGVKGPRTPVLLLKRAFGLDCFDVYFQSVSHKVLTPAMPPKRGGGGGGGGGASGAGNDLQPVLLAGGGWQTSQKTPLEEAHYVPMQPVARAKRRPTNHSRDRLMQYLVEQSRDEEAWLYDGTPGTAVPAPRGAARPRCTVYMDGVFDLLHVGHLEAVQQCIAMGDRVIIGVTGDTDAANYKRHGTYKTFFCTVSRAFVGATPPHPRRAMVPMLI